MHLVQGMFGPGLVNTVLVKTNIRFTKYQQETRVPTTAIFRPGVILAAVNNSGLSSIQNARLNDCMIRIRIPGVYQLMRSY